MTAARKLSEQNSHNETTRKRAFELDLLRGFAIFMMILHHFAFDLRFIFQYNVFGFIDGTCNWFWAFLHPFFILIFVMISGICCQFSRNNFKRALKLGLIAIAFSVVTITADHFLMLGCAIYFNVLHLLTLATLLFAIFDAIEQKKTGSRDSRQGTMVLFLIVAAFFLLQHALPFYQFTLPYKWSFILGLEPDPKVIMPVMGDEMPIIPWVGVFFVGVLIGRFVYQSKETLFPNAPKAFLTATRPLEWIGKHSLLVYLIHQPIVLGILYLLQYLGVIK